MTTMPEQKTRPRQARELARRLGQLTEAQAAAGWGIVIIFAALLGAIYLNQTSKIGTIGRRIQMEQQDLDELRFKNAELERKIAESQSLERLSNEAIRLGFIPSTPNDIEYVVIPNYPVQPIGESVIEEVPDPIPLPPDTVLEAVTLALRDLGIGLTRGEVNDQ